MTSTTEAKTADALAERLTDSIIGTIDVFTVYLGDRLGYYRALTGAGWMTPGELAQAAGTEERYATEWLEQQTISEIIEVDDVAAVPATRRYRLPAGYAEALTDDVSLAYIAPFARMVTAAGIQLPEIAAAHRSGGGVSWEAFGEEVRESQGDMNRPFFVGLLGSEWFPAVPDLHERLTAGGRVADIGCGFGWSSIAIAQAYPGVEVHGYDIDEPSIDRARQHAAEQGVADRVTFHKVDAGTALAQGEFDVVTAFECIHDLPQPIEVLKTIRGLAADDGIVVIMDEKVAPEFGAFGDDIERIMYGFSNLICLPDGLSHEGSVGTGTVMRPDRLEAYARDAGFEGLEILPIDADLWRFYRLV